MRRRDFLIAASTLGLLGCAHAEAQRGPSMPALGPLPPNRPPVLPVPRQAAPQRICLGSCNKHERPQEHWDVIRQLHPDLWIWMGDIIYGDTAFPMELREKYAALLSSPPYQRFLAEVPVVGTWDDHDYGFNDGGMENTIREKSQREILDFLGEPQDSPRRQQRGIYTSYDLGSVPDQVRLILLDGRYHREKPGPAADPLGAEQWAWLEDQLRSSTATINIIVNGYQVVSEEHPYESWSHFTGARKRLFELVRDSGARGTMFVTGDRHHAELSRWEDEAWPYPLYDFTTSGLTHAGRTNEEANRHRVGELYREQNFGRIDFDWKARALTYTVHDIGGDVVFSHRVPFAEIGETNYAAPSAYDDE